MEGAQERYSAGSVLGPRCHFRSIRTCCAMAAAMRLPTLATILVRYKPISGHKNIQHTVRYTELSPDRLNEAAVAALKLLANRDCHGMLMADRPVWNARTDVSGADDQNDLDLTSTGWHGDFPQSSCADLASAAGFLSGS
jgi:hypothetical protein